MILKSKIIFNNSDNPLLPFIKNIFQGLVNCDNNNWMTQQQNINHLQLIEKTSNPDTSVPEELAKDSRKKYCSKLPNMKQRNGLIFNYNQWPKTLIN